MTKEPAPERCGQPPIGSPTRVRLPSDPPVKPVPESCADEAAIRRAAAVIARIQARLRRENTD